MRRFFWFLLVPTLLCADWPWQGNWCCSSDQWNPSLETIGQAGNFRKGGGALIFSPIGQSCGSILFGQAQGGIFRELYTGSLGFGYRQQAEPGQYSWGNFFAWGVNAFFDVARSNSKRVYYQGSLGGEILGDCWLFRANGYFPSRNRHILSTRRVSSVSVNGTNIISTDNFFDTTEQGYHGFDLEVGKGLQIGCGQLWGYAGYYNFNASKASTQQGPRLRLDYTLDQAFSWCPLELTAGGEWSRDQVHGSTVSGYLSLRIPFCNTRRSSSCCDGICRLMGDPVFRNRAIWVDRDERLSDWPVTQQIGRIFFADGVGGGTGTQAAPVDIDAAFALATDPGDVIFCLPDNGFLSSGANTLGSNQQLVSFGTDGRAAIPLEGRTLVVQPISTNGSAATVEATVTNMLTLAGTNSNHRVAGLILDGNSAVGDNAIVSGDVVSLQVYEVAIQDFDVAAISDQSMLASPFVNLSFDHSRVDILSTGSEGIFVNGSQTQPLSLQIRNSEISAGTRGANIRRLGTVDFLVRNSSLVNNDAIGGGVLFGSGMLEDNNILIDNTTYTNNSGGVLLRTLSPVNAATVSNRAILNSSTTTSPLLNLAETGSPSGNSRYNAVVARNNVDEGITVNISEYFGDFFIFENNFGNTVRIANPRNVWAVTMRNNINTADYSSTSLLGMPICTTFDGNTGTGATFTSSTALTNLQTLGSLNNGMPITTTGSSDSVIPCQLP